MVCEPVGVHVIEDLNPPLASHPAVEPKEQGGWTKGLGGQGVEQGDTVGAPQHVKQNCDSVSMLELLVYFLFIKIVCISASV